MSTGQSNYMIFEVKTTGYH